MPLDILAEVIDPITGAVGGSPLRDLPVVGAAFGPTGERGLTTGEGGAVAGLDLLNPLTLLSEILGVPADLVQGALETVGLTTGTGQGAGGLSGISGAIRGAGPAAANLQGFSRGNGRTANRTVVQTLDLVTNKIIRERIMPGTPHMMNSDIRAAKKVFRQSAELHAKMPRRTTKESPTTQLKNQLVQRAMNNVACPPKCE